MIVDNLQKTFKDNYTKRLKDNVKDNVSLDLYKTGEFDIDEEQVRYVSGVYTPKGLLQKLMKAESRCEAAIILFEAYKDLPLTVASQESFWTYLTHVDLYEFAKKEWPLEKTRNLQSHIIDHWFFGKNGYNRNACASLWWSVFCSYDESREDPYELTRVLFLNYSFRVIWLKILLRTKNALLGVLEYLRRHPEVTSGSLENRGLFISKYFNALGATKQLSSLPQQFFIDELEKLTSTLLSINSRADITGKDAFAMLEVAEETEEEEMEE
jgi:hypothetical protein